MKKGIIFTLMVLGASFALAVTPSAYSTQQALLNSGDTVAQTDSGNVVCQYFTYTTTALTNATVALTRIPANSRIIGGQISVAAMGGAEVFDLGLVAVDGGGYINKPSTTADDVDLFLDGIAVSNAVLDTFGYLVDPGAISDTNPNYAG